MLLQLKLQFRKVNMVVQVQLMVETILKHLKLKQAVLPQQQLHLTQNLLSSHPLIHLPREPILLQLQLLQQQQLPQQIPMAVAVQVLLITIFPLFESKFNVANEK
jgi:hypothetical protein